MKKNLILLVFAFSLQCCGQEKETTYWEIEKIYREDKKPFIGLTGYYMQEIFDNNLHYNATNDHLEVVNQPEDDRIRDIIEPSK